MPRIPLFSGSVSINVIVAYLFTLILLYLVAGPLLGLSRRSGKFLARSALTTLAIIGINLVGGLVGYRVPLNLVTILIPTILGFPGFALVTLLQYLLF
ncbi:MAG: hypothetical protein GX060_07170 [Firmicutes bacterium]|nr:hypothetical protein [Bacillota bacterium]